MQLYTEHIEKKKLDANDNQLTKRYFYDDQLKEPPSAVPEVRSPPAPI